ncbi:MAG: hypothetical protein M3406_06035 [Chloroflexota bacterium]|nr:hypothetical protein [Chloroflexota bacterium]
MDPRIADYIRANRKKYTREVIREQLVTAGHDPAEIDATWAALDAPDPDAVAGEGFWGRFWLFLVGLNVAVFLIVVLVSGLLNSIVVAVALGIALSIGALMAWGIVAATGPAKMGGTTAIVIGGVIPLVFALLIGGSCYALVGSIGPPPPPAHEGVIELAIEPPLDFDGSGSALCQPHGTSTGFSVFSQELGFIEGRAVTVSVDSYATEAGPDGAPAPAPGPGGEEAPNVFVSLQPRAENDPAREWFATPQARVEIDAAPDGLSGTVTFEELEPAEPGADAISGTITWECE